MCFIWIDPSYAATCGDLVEVVPLTAMPQHSNLFMVESVHGVHLWTKWGTGVGSPVKYYLSNAPLMYECIWGTRPGRTSVLYWTLASIHWWTGKELEGKGHGPIWVVSLPLQGRRKTMKNLSQESQRPGRDSKQALPEYNSWTLLLHHVA